VSVTAGDVVSMLTDGTVAKGLTGTHLSATANFNAADTSNIYATKLTATTFAIAFVDVGNSSRGTAVVATVANGVITYGSEYVFNTGTTAHLSVIALTESKIAVIYRDATNSSYGTISVGNIAGTVITFGSEYVFNSAASTHISSSALSATQVAIAYKDGGNSNYGTGIIANIAGTVATFGSAVVFNAASTAYTATECLTATKFITVYRDEGASNAGTSVVGSVVGDVITFGAEYVYNAGTSNYLSISVRKLSETKIIVAYRDGGESDYGNAVVGDIAGDVITYGSEYVFNSAVSNYCTIAILSAITFAICYMDDGGDDYGAMKIGTVSSGTTISYSSETIFSAAASTFISAVALDSLNITIALKDGSDSNYGKSILIGIHGDMTGKLGIAQETGAETENIIVATDGISNSHTGLTPASLYYSNVWGDISTTVPNIPIGFALSATEILTGALTFADIITGATATTTYADDDYVLISDTSESAALRKMPILDFYDPHTVLLIHSDTTDASTTFTDSSDSAHAITPVADVHHETDDQYFGATSIYFDGTGDFLTADHHANWALGAGDFTIAFWANLSDVSATRCFVSQYADADRSFVFFWDVGGNMIFSYSTDGTSALTNAQFASTPSTGTWYHIAVVRNGADLKCYANGTQIGSTYDISTDTIFDSGQILKIGSVESTYYMYGYLDEFRITKGRACWLANFTPPTAAYN